MELGTGIHGWQLPKDTHAPSSNGNSTNNEPYTLNHINDSKATAFEKPPDAQGDAHFLRVFTTGCTPKDPGSRSELCWDQDYICGYFRKLTCEFLKVVPVFFQAGRSVAIPKYP